MKYYIAATATVQTSKTMAPPAKEGTPSLWSSTFNPVETGRLKSRQTDSKSSKRGAAARGSTSKSTSRGR